MVFQKFRLELREFYRRISIIKTREEKRVKNSTKSFTILLNLNIVLVFTKKNIH